MMNLLQAAGGQSQLSFFLMIGLMFLVMWLFMWRPESKRRKEMQKFREGLKKGDKIVTAGGIYATARCASKRTWAWPPTASSRNSPVADREP